MDLFPRYPYLAGSLLLTALFAAGFAAFKDQRRPMLLSGMLSTPFGFASLIFVPEYWSPVRLVEFGAGIEDLLFSFSSGGIAWLLAVWPFRKRVSLDLDVRRIARGYAAICLACTVATALCMGAGLPVMVATLVSVLALGFALLLLRFRHLPLFLSGTSGFALLYTAWISGVALIWPHFLAQWSHENLLGVRFARGIPLEELIWALGYGGVWPLFMAFVFGCRMGGRPSCPLEASR